MLSFLDAGIWFQNCHQMMDKLSSNNALISEFCEIFVSLFFLLHEELCHLGRLMQLEVHEVLKELHGDSETAVGIIRMKRNPIYFCTHHCPFKHEKTRPCLVPRNALLFTLFPMGCHHGPSTWSWPHWWGLMAISTTVSMFIARDVITSRAGFTGEEK